MTFVILIFNFFIIQCHVVFALSYKIISICSNCFQNHSRKNMLYYIHRSISTIRTSTFEIQKNRFSLRQHRPLWPALKRRPSRNIKESKSLYERQEICSLAFQSARFLVIPESAVYSINYLIWFSNWLRSCQSSRAKLILRSHRRAEMVISVVANVSTLFSKQTV